MVILWWSPGAYFPHAPTGFCFPFLSFFLPSSLLPVSPSFPLPFPRPKMSWLAGYGKDADEENDNLGVDWVLQYEFGDIGTSLFSTIGIYWY